MSKGISGLVGTEVRNAIIAEILPYDIYCKLLQLKTRIVAEKEDQVQQFKDMIANNYQ